MQQLSEQTRGSGRSVGIVLLLIMIQISCIPFGDAWFDFKGTVRDPKGQPIAGATLKILVNGKLAGDRSTETTDAQGRYAFHENSCPCDFTFALVVTKSDYQEAHISRTSTEANQMRTLDITLEPVAK